jgi:hypothetical protein
VGSVPICSSCIAWKFYKPGAICDCAREKLFTLLSSFPPVIEFHSAKSKGRNLRVLSFTRSGLSAMVQILADCRGKVISQYRFYTPGEQSAAYYSGHRARGILFYARSVA